jgi:D-glycerate 3-kinase
MYLEQLVREIENSVLSRLKSTRPLVVGFSGAQGSGKSTICGSLQNVLTRRGLVTLTLCLDDFYLKNSERLVLGEEVHPLCTVRGVPGTHDVKYLKDTLVALMQADGSSKTCWPSFSKACDDRYDQDKFYHHEGHVDVILLEGWCVGAQSSFVQSFSENEWEAEHDQHCRWKVWTKNAAVQYESIWRAIDLSVMLFQNSFERVIDARWQQEKDLLKRSGESQFQSREEVVEFCQYYCSWTRGMCAYFPDLADLVFYCLEGYSYAVRNT